MIGGAKGLKEEDQHRHWEYPIAYEAQFSGHHVAAFFGLEYTVLTLLLDESVELSRLEPKLGSALLVASAEGDCSLVRLLLDNNANANATSWLDYTPLHLAVQQGHLAIARLLLDADADVTRRCSSNAYTALHIAARNGHEIIVQALLNWGSNADTMSDSGTSLHSAAGQGHAPIVRMLLAHGANVNAVCLTGITALHLAVKINHEPVV